jgi:hypothetical protein
VQRAALPFALLAEVSHGQSRADMLTHPLLTDETVFYLLDAFHQEHIQR